jgi:uncharacterized membrane protein
LLAGYAAIRHGRTEPSEGQRIASALQGPFVGATHRVARPSAAGWKLIIIGNGIGFLFALAVLAISVVSFPLLLDRDVGAVEAALTSLRAVAANPIPMAVWG